MVFPDKKLIFLLPPKCGTSSFTSLIKESTSLDLSKNTLERHALLSQMVKYYDIKDLQNYKIYQLCRHPLDKLTSSFYYHKTPKGGNPWKNTKLYNFNETLEIVLPHVPVLPNYSLFYRGIRKGSRIGFRVRHIFYSPQTNWNDLNADVEYLKLEDLIQDTSKLSLILKEDIPHEFPNKNKGTKRPSISYLETYTKENLELAYKVYEKDFEILGYN